MRYALARKYNVEDVQYLALLRAFGHQKFPCPISSDRSRKKKEREKGKSLARSKGNVSSLVTFSWGSAANCNYYECDLR